MKQIPYTKYINKLIKTINQSQTRNNAVLKHHKIILFSINEVL